MSQLPQFEREVQSQAHVGIVKVLAGKFLNSIHAVKQRVAVDKKRLGRLADIAMVAEVSAKR